MRPQVRWLRQYRWRLSLDIRRYFPSIHHETLCELFSRRLGDRRTIELIRAMIAAGGEVYRTPVAISVLGLETEPVPPGRGLPLGGYLSHWSGGLYLDGLDHYVKRELKIAAYLRYMDDFTLFGNDRAELEEAREAIRDWLARERKLSLKPARDRVQPCSQPSTVLGFRVSRAGVSPGSKAKRRLRARLRKAESLGVERLVRSLQAYRGMMLSL
ncbi:MAG: RNA-directed DNA polymerase [Proteobacteria bacterium]|nr:RNA-directed DNA polymerase [Pseudomonadota bacterium]